MQLAQRGCQFSSTVTRRLQNHIRFRSREKQVALKPVEGYIRFRPRLLFTFVSPSAVLIPVAARIEGSNPAVGHGCLSFVSVVFCVGSDLCVRLITRPDESYRVRYVILKPRQWGLGPLRAAAPWNKISSSMKTIPRCPGMWLPNQTWSAWIT
jgi:hypothetical protein